VLRNTLKKTMSVILTGAFLLGFTGCFNSGSKKAVLEAAEVLAGDMAAADASKLIKNSTLSKKSNEAAAITELLSNDGYSEDETAFFKAVEKTIEYEIDEESVSVDKDTASVNIVFTLADYNDVLSEEYKDIGELTSAVKKADTVTVKFTAEFSKEDKEWIPDNVGSKKFMKLYDYRNAEISFELTADMIASFIDRDESCFWVYDNGGGSDKYVDTTFIEYDYYFDQEVLDYQKRGEIIFYKILKDGEVIYTSPDMIFGETVNLSCRVESNTVGLDFLEYFESGTYSVELYYRGKKGEELVDSNSIPVEKSVTTVWNPGSSSSDYFDGENEYYAFNDPEFRNYVLDAGWNDYGNYMTGPETYASDVETLSFYLEVKPDCNITVEYGYYYTDQEDQSAINEALQNPVYANSVTPVSNTAGKFYEIDYEVGGNAEPGYYMFVLYESGTSKVLMYGFCFVS